MNGPTVSSLRGLPGASNVTQVPLNRANFDGD
jgi:hypothetical protein